MNIAIVSDAVYPYNKGGKEKRIYEISTRLVKLGHEVHIYCMHWPTFGVTSKKSKAQSESIENGVHLHAISPYYPLYSGDKRSIKQALLFSLHCLKLVRVDFDVIDVDHMPFFPIFAVKLVCILKGKKMFATWHEIWGFHYWQKYLGLLGLIAFIVERLSVILPNKIIAVSNLTASRLKKEFGVRQPINIIPNGIDYETIQRVKPSKENSDIIFVGRLLQHKNVNTLIKAVNLLKMHFGLSVKCIIIGDGPEKNNLLQLAKKLDLEKNIKFLNSNNSQEKIYALMKSSKVFVLPSTREGFGIVVLEANACGLPVITINHPDNAAKDLIKKSNGLLIDLSVDQIAEALHKVLQNYSTFKFTSNHNFSWDKSTKKLLEAYTI